MDVLRKMFLFGLGVTSTSRENAKQFFDEMVTRGEMSSDEATDFFDEMSKRGEEERQEFTTMISQEFDKLREKMGLVTRAEFEELKTRMEQLEQKLNGQ